MGALAMNVSRWGSGENGVRLCQRRMGELPVQRMKETDQSTGTLPAFWRKFVFVVLALGVNSVNILVLLRLLTMSHDHNFVGHLFLQTLNTPWMTEALLAAVVLPL
jgi:hypothetical protein